MIGSIESRGMSWYGRRYGPYRTCIALSCRRDKEKVSSRDGSAKHEGMVPVKLINSKS